MLHKPEDLEVVRLPDPHPLQGEVLLKIEACSVCGSDLEGFHGIHPKMTYPRVMGHEYAGTVLEAGPGAPGALVGKRVVSVGNVACGKCAPCSDGRPDACVQPLSPGFTAHGAYAEYLAVPAASCVTLPDELTFAEAAIAQPFSIAYHACVRACVTEGDTVMVQGCGPIGIGVMMHAKARGAMVFSTDIVDYRKSLAQKLGADYVFSGATDNLGDKIAEITKGHMMDKVIECVGSDQDSTLAQAVRCVKTGGLVVVVGSFARDCATIPIIDFKFSEKGIIGSQGMPEGYGPTIDLLIKKKIHAKPLITHTVLLEGVGKAFELLDAKEDDIVKALVMPAK